MQQTTQTINRIQQLTGACIFAMVCISWSFWSSDRDFPTAPLFGVYSFLTGTIGFNFKLLLLLSAALLALRIKFSGWAVSALLLIAIADDLNRFNAPLFQYMAIVLFFAVFKNAGEVNLINAFRIMQAGMYIWTGIQKLNFHYIDSTGNFFQNTFHLQLPHNALYFLFLFPVVEIAIGLCFLFGKKLRIAVLSSVVLHAFIVNQLLVSHWNEGMILYNVFLVAGNLILFSPFQTGYSLFSFKSPAGVVAMLFFLVLPALNFINLWPTYMSAGMYSSRAWVAVIYLDEEAEQQLPPSAKTSIYDSPRGRYLAISYWMERETGFVPNPERIVYNKLFAQMKDRYHFSDNVRLYLYK